MCFLPFVKRKAQLKRFYTASCDTSCKCFNYFNTSWLHQHTFLLVQDNVLFKASTASGLQQDCPGSPPCETGY